MARQVVRPAAVAGSWYPGQGGALAREVDRYLDLAADPPAGDVLAVIAPHAGLLYSGPVGAYAYRALRGRTYDVAVLVGPSHFVGFDGVAIVDEGAFEIRSGWCPSTRRSPRRSSTLRPSCTPARRPTPASTRSRCSCRSSSACNPRRRSCRR